MTQRFTTECKGCLLFNQAIECKLLELYKADQCPCIICLVKPMCEEPCDAFNILTGDIDEDE